MKTITHETISMISTSLAQVSPLFNKLIPSFTTRYIDAVDEYCGNALVADVPGCDSGQTFHELDSAIYNDVQVAWTKAFNVENFKLSLGVNNLFDEDPPICYTCSLNGYDAGTYDLPGMFWAVTAKYGF